MKHICSFKSFFVIALGYILIFNISFFTPMHSDDFGTALNGFPALSQHWGRYFDWSGRVTADFVSSFIMWLDCHWVIAAVNSLGGVILITIITCIALKVSKADKGIFYKIFFVTFFVYWFGNPNLGQTTFWVVGAANYLWTSVIFMGFVFFVFYVNGQGLREKNKTQSSVGLLLGALTGCTNENISITMVLFSLFFCIFNCVKNKRLNYVLIFSFLGVFIGCLVLILSPGNKVRLHSEASFWLEYSLYEKLLYGAKQVASAYWKNKFLFALFFVSAILAVSFSWGKYKFKKGFKAIKKEGGAEFIVIVAIATIANFVMILSPGYPARAMNGQFVLYLTSYAIVCCWLAKYLKKSFYLLFFICAVLFFISYSLMNLAYRSTFSQDEIRRSIMVNAQESGAKMVIIPEFFFPPLLKDGEKFDLFHADPMAKYFGLEKVDYQPASFDYSTINSDACEKVFFAESGTSGCVYSYSYLFGAKSVLIGVIAENKTSESEKFEFLVRQEDSNNKKVVVEKILATYPLKINGSYYYVLGDKWGRYKNISLEKIDRL